MSLNGEEELRKKLKEMIDEIPVEKLKYVVDVFEGLLVAERHKEKEPALEVAEVSKEEFIAVVFDLEADTDAVLTEEMFTGIKDGKYEYRSAVNIGNKVRTLKCESGSVRGFAIIIITKDSENALTMRMLLDSALAKTVKVVEVKRADFQVLVRYIQTGYRKEKPKKERRFTYKDTDGEELVDAETGEPIWQKAKRGGAGETPYLYKKAT